MRAIQAEMTARDGVGVAMVGSGHGAGGLRRWLALFNDAASGVRMDLRGFWIFQAVFWTASGVSLIILLETFYQLPRVAPIVVGRISTGVLVAVILHHLYMGRRIREMRGWPKFVWVLALNVGATLASSAVWLGLMAAGFPELPSESPFSSLAVARGFSLLTWNTAYFCVLLLMEYHAARLEAAEARLTARAGELEQLRSQINPHFLLNSLNSVLAEKDDPDKVEALILALAGYLRFSLQQGREVAPLGKELDALEDYLRVEKIRFEEKLEFQVVADPAARRHEVPNAVILPLLENAIKYGQRTSPWPLRVRISASIVDERLVVEVANSGRWVEPGVSMGSGIGLANLRKRLDLLYAGKAEVREESAGLEVRVRVKLPCGVPPFLP